MAQRVSIQPAVEHDVALPLGAAKTRRIEPAVERDFALPLKAIQSAFTPPPRTATRAERRRWMEADGIFLGYAGLGVGVGGLFAGRAGGVVAGLAAGLYGAIRAYRRAP